MRVFVAGATGVIGIRLLPLLLAAGHEVAAMTRSPEKVERLQQLGALPVVCDVFDLPALREAVVAFAPEAVVSELTDLPDDLEQLRQFEAANDRIRREGTRNLVDAARAAHARRFLAQSIAWQLPGERGRAVEELEQMVLEEDGVVLRYGRLYGPGTFYVDELPEPPRVQVDEAARRTADLLEADSGVVTVVDELTRRVLRSASRRPAEP
jgi:NAD(P)-dependent dehydrogenase (short-subunit alcohol dehydrogenase family)